MTQNEFWKLYDSGKIQVKVWEGTEDEMKKEISSFEYNGKFYLRITKSLNGKSWYSELKHRRTHTRGWLHSVIKEFDSKDKANNYFKKAAVGMNRVK